jgi:opacity protein-like surface antigen
MASRSSKFLMTGVAWGAMIASVTATPFGAFAQDKPASGAVATEASAKKDESGKTDAKPDAKAAADAKDGKGAKDAKAGDGKGGKDEKKPEDKKSYYIPTRGYRLEPQPDIPPYVRNLGKTFPQFKGIDWLDVGLDSRVRFDYRNNDYNTWVDSGTNPANTSQRRLFPNSLWLSRTRVYVGVKEILDPFRAVVEFQDSRAYNSIYELQGQDINYTDLISAYGELYFKDAFGKDPHGNDRPLTVRGGRFHFELLDRRLIAENEFRNTTNTFEGFRLKIGKKENDWDSDSFIMRPLIRLPFQFDRPDWQNIVYGSVFSYRGWSPAATIQPYFLGRTQYADQTNTSAAARVHRETYAPGLRMYGVVGNWDYDFDVNKQFGALGRLQSINGIAPSVGGLPLSNIEVTVPHNAFAWALDTGYTFAEHPWKPRVSFVYIYGSGNGSPFNYSNSNLDTFYGFNQPFSRSNYISWNNVKDPKIRLEATPAKNLQIDTAFSAYWLADAANAQDRINLNAPLGNRGTFLGTEVDFRVRYKLSQYINLTASYDHFMPGSFTYSFAPPVAGQFFYPYNGVAYTNPAFGITGTGTTNGLTAKPTDFFYLEAQINAFGDGQPIDKDPISELLGYVGPGSKAIKPPSWRDVYVGLNAGGAWSNPATTTLTGPAYVQSLSPLDKSVVANPTSIALANASSILDGANRLAGFVGGIQVGANWRFDNNIVVGMESDLDGTAGNTSNTMQGSSTVVGKSSYLNYGQRTTQLNYLGTVRGKLGYLPTPVLQVYGTGGFAYGGVISNTALFTLPTGTVNWTLADANYQDVLAGWSAGGGFEWMFMPDWSLKTEYLYYNLGTVHANGANALRNGYNATNASWTNLGTLATAYDYSVSTQTKFSGNVVRAGVNRHFDLLSE